MQRGFAGGLLTGVVLSLAAGILSPVWRPAASRWGRPLAKAAIKQGILAYGVIRSRTAELGETLTDLVAEAQFEMMSERSAGREAAPTSGGSSDD